jgi:hypothetical protein
VTSGGGGAAEGDITAITLVDEQAD